MINLDKLKAILVDYKKDFVSKQWEKERYKWEAVKYFQDHWDINVPDFGGMFMEATEKTSNLLTSMNNFPRGMIKNFATADGEVTRAMFINLFDETKDITARVEKFQKDADALLTKYGALTWKKHYQKQNPISTYLWLRYPDKYYPYKYEEFCTVAKALGSDFVFKRGTPSNPVNGFNMYNELCEQLKADGELVQLLQSVLTDNCYPDKALKTLTSAVGFYISCSASQTPEIDTDAEENSISHVETADSCFYSKEVFLEEVYVTDERFDTLVALLKKKQNLILHGAPGVGKTYAAKRLAYAMMQEKDESRIEFIQFHQSYSYEDFIMGYKPQGEGFELQNGIFYNFCQKAADMPDKPFFFIIDEINRGNMSKIFGELLMLIEKDYRGTEATLAYNRMPFSVPENLYLIGMMNTADRSLAMIDYALRRRFSFFEMTPGFDAAGFKAYQDSLDNETFDDLIKCIKDLNRDISADSSLGDGFCIGHSYFCNFKRGKCTDEQIRLIVEHDIIPMLKEYWFDESEKLSLWENKLRGVFND